MDEIDAQNCDKWIQSIIYLESDIGLASEDMMKSLEDLRIEIDEMLPRGQKVVVTLYVGTRLYETKIKGKEKENLLKISINSDGRMKSCLESPSGWTDASAAFGSAIIGTIQIVEQLVLAVAYGIIGTVESLFC